MKSNVCVCIYLSKDQTRHSPKQTNNQPTNKTKRQRQSECTSMVAHSQLASAVGRMVMNSLSIMMSTRIWTRLVDPKLSPCRSRKDFTRLNTCQSVITNTAYNTVRMR